MIFTIHLLVGAAIATQIKIIPLAFLLAFFSHYFLDSLPHWDYFVKNIQIKNWGESLPEFLKGGLDMLLGLGIILFFSRDIFVLLGAFFAVLVDVLIFLNLIFSSKWLKIHNDLHLKIHFPEDKKVSSFLTIPNQLLIVIIAVFFLR